VSVGDEDSLPGSTGLGDQETRPASPWFESVFNAQPVTGTPAGEYLAAPLRHQPSGPAVGRDRIPQAQQRSVFAHGLHGIAGGLPVDHAGPDQGDDYGVGDG